LFFSLNFQVGTPLEEDLGSWGHHFHSTSVPDTILQASAGDEVFQHFPIFNVIPVQKKKKQNFL
jgi:DNA repair and recombination RAD54-like protein